MALLPFLVTLRRHRAARAAGLARATLFLGVLAALSVSLLLRSASAGVGEGLTEFGRELLAWPATRSSGEPRELLLNGLRLRLATASTPRSVRDALKRLRASCREHGSVWRDASTKPTPAAAGTDLHDSPAFSWESENEGVAACLDMARSRVSTALLDRFRQFAATGDLANLGELRYAVARRSGDTTTLLVVWTEGATPLLAAFPKNGDAPGVDPVDIPRPPRSRRILSAVEPGAPSSLTSYLVEGTSAGSLTRWYEGALMRGGFTVAKEPEGLLARRLDRVILVRTIARDTRTIASIAQM